MIHALNLSVGWMMMREYVESGKSCGDSLGLVTDLVDERQVA